MSLANFHKPTLWFRPLWHPDPVRCTPFPAYIKFEGNEQGDHHCQTCGRRFGRDEEVYECREELRTCDDLYYLDDDWELPSCYCHECVKRRQVRPRDVPREVWERARAKEMRDWRVELRA